MAKGLERRAATETNEMRSLRSMGQIKPVALPQGPGPASNPRLPHVNVQPSVGQRIADGFATFAQEQLGKAARIQNEKSMMEGQMAAQQGKTFEDIQMGGDKWALEGYRLVEAQQLASSLLTAQRAEIAQGLYENGPDQYRANFINRVEGVLSSTEDQRTAELARDQLLKQMPVLVEDHMAQHLQWKEQKNFDTLANSVDTLSMDVTSHDALVAFANGGEGSPTAGLSEDRRREAVVTGVMKAFENDNPQAYAVLASAGVFKDMPVAQQRQVKSARAAFETRARKKFNAEFITAEKDLMRQIENGALEPQQAMELYGDLMAEHNMTITAQEAGAIYDTANDGIRVRRINTATAAQEAVLRGDRDTAITMIRNSLIGTESGGNSGAFRTNKDSRQYGGLLQFGDGRLADYARATGTPAMTAAEFRKLTPAEQEVVDRWHINDILDHIEAKGYDKMVGEGINGVSLTYSGMVAVAHLGGKGGLDKMIATGGQYNPADELGTSLTDYLRKHGNGVDLTPEQMHRSAQKRIAVLREAAAIEQYEQMQPQLDAITEAYTSVNSTMTDEQYRAAMADVRAQFNVAQTMAGAKFERDVILEVQGAAQARLDEANGLEAGAKIEQALSTFDKVLTAYSKGEASTEDVLMAQQTMQQDTAAIRQEYGIPLDSDEEIRQYRKQMAAFKKAMKARIEFDDEQRQIDAAEASGTLHELPAKLQKRAIDAHKETVRKGLDEQARKGALEGDALYTEFESQMADYYARTGTVDPVLERTVNGFLAGGLVDKNGEPRAEYIEAAEQYRMLHERSPTVADRYIRTENRSMLDAVLDIAAGGDLAGAVRTVGVRQSLAPRAQTTADFMADPGTVLVIDSAVSNYLDREEIGVAQALTQRDADLQQTLNRSWFDQFGVQDDANRELLTGRVTQEVAQAHAREPLAKPSELVRAATRRVQERTPIIGGIAVPLPGDGPSAGEMFFGARAADFSDQAGAINDAVMDHFRTPEFRERYGFVDDTTFRESLPTWLGGAPETQLQTLWTGVRPFQTYWDSGSKSLVVQFALPGGGYSDAIALDTRKIGQQYIKKHTANAAD